MQLKQLKFGLSFGFVLLLSDLGSGQDLSAISGGPSGLLGKAGTAAEATLPNVTVNPALGGELDSNSISLIWGVENSDYTFRYPGFAAHSKAKTSLTPIIPIPKFSWHPSRDFSIGGIAMPFPLSQEIEANDIPLVVFGQENFAEIHAMGRLKAYADLFAGYRFSNDMSGGLAFKYLGFSADGTLSARGKSDSNLATFNLESESVDLVAGWLLNYLPNLRLGFKALIYRSVTTKSFFETAAQSEEKAVPKKNINTGFLSQFRFGSSYSFSSLTLLLDLEYTRVKKDQKRFSLVGFKEKELDAYDTLAFFSGSKYKLDSNWDLLGGIFYEPASIGPGDAGTEGKTGFGFLDFATSLGAPPSKPSIGIGLGARLSLIAERPKIRRKKRDSISSTERKHKKKESIQTKNSVEKVRFLVDFGIVYSETEIGISKSGEQPGAYLVRRIQLPVQVIYNF